MELNILYQDDNVLVIDKPAGVNSDDFKKRAHRLDKDTSGILVVAKNDRALAFFQKQFGEGKAKKKYLALVVGNLRDKKGEAQTLLGRSAKDRRKQKVYFAHDPKTKGKRLAITKYKVLQRFKDYDFIEAEPLTGRKHQIRAHFSHLGRPVAGDKLYGFKNQIWPKGLLRQFLHASYLKLKLPDGRIKEFHCELSSDLKKVLEDLNVYDESN